MTAGPPKARYRLSLQITANTLEELEQELDARAIHFAIENRGRHTRDEVGPRHHLVLEHANPTMTPERYDVELRAWWAAQRPARANR